MSLRAARAFNPANVAITGGSITGQTGTPYILAQSFAAVNTPADTTEDTLATITVPANTLGANGSLRIWTWWEATNNVNVKTIKVKFGASTYLVAPMANLTNGTFLTYVFNKNATNAQSGGFLNAGAIGLGTSASGAFPSAVDTTASTTIVMTGQKATAGDTLTLAGYSVEVVRFA